jgi:nicotinate phosphoribosyltransferase
MDLPAPIITSLLDVDFYKFTMGQFLWRRHRGVPVTFAFKDRSKNVRLPELIREEDLRRELEHVRTLRFKEDELDYLRGLDTFKEAFLGFLSGLRLPPVRIRKLKTAYRIEAAGAWPEVTWWETIVLSIVNELYYRAVADRKTAWPEGGRRLGEKLRLIESRPDIRFIEFGTRRRFSRAWQDYVVGALAKRNRLMKERGRGEPCLGTSNVLQARTHGLAPMGTMAHELFMGAFALASSGSDEDLRASHGRVLREWHEEHGEPLSIALSDTFGTGFFFEDWPAEEAGRWKGLRQDSGDPFAFGEKAIAFYERCGIDPAPKTVVFSDGLDAEKIVALHERFSGRIGVAFGWGTNLTNDLGFETLHLVMKLVEADGRPAVKLSDEPGKETGPKRAVARAKRVFRKEGS